MCRNIRPLFNFDPPATDEEIHDAAVQFVRKVSGTRKPSGKTVFPFERAVEDIAAVTRKLVDSPETTAHPQHRDAQPPTAPAPRPHPSPPSPRPPRPPHLL